jgi:YebC/PmpR family DNA-binding regulatory protein
MAIDQARAVNLPKANVERILKQAEEKEGQLEEVLYEGFGPSGVSVIAEVVTDNRNRTGQEIKNLFERGGGGLGGPGSVSFNFKPMGYVLIKPGDASEEKVLELMDIGGVEDVEETKSGIEVYVAANKLSSVMEIIKSRELPVIESSLMQKPINLKEISDSKIAEKVLSFLEALDDHDDVQKVYANVDIPDDVLKSLPSSNS